MWKNYLLIVALATKKPAKARRHGQNAGNPGKAGDATAATFPARLATVYKTT